MNNGNVPEAITPEDFDWETSYHLEELIGHKVDPFLIQAALQLRQQWRDSLWAEHGSQLNQGDDSKAQMEIRGRARQWAEAEALSKKQDEIRRFPFLFDSAGFSKHCCMYIVQPPEALCEACPQAKAGKLCDEAPVAMPALEMPKKKKNKGWSPEARARAAARRENKRDSGRRMKIIADMIESNPEIKAISDQDHSRAYDIAWDIADEQVDREKNKKK